MTKSTKSQLAFLLVVLVGIGFLNCKGSPKQQPLDEQTYKSVEQREAEFMEKRAKYIEEHGHDKHYNMQNGRVYE
jgi:hypothetical protein